MKQVYRVSYGGSNYTSVLIVADSMEQALRKGMEMIEDGLYVDNIALIDNRDGKEVVYVI